MKKKTLEQIQEDKEKELLNYNETKKKIENRRALYIQNQYETKHLEIGSPRSQTNALEFDERALEHVDAVLKDFALHI